ncbi:MAG TPA: hypothetical protein VE596_13500 [Gaiellaceae bacterium]|jgi:hypothetical protein|nr:hypothetical protein [Gaiellaceae bacterium]
MSAPEEDIDRLYGLPLDEFTRARDELARRVRREGDGERAAEIKQLRKPTLPAWVVNQLARERELDVQRLLKAGKQLAGAQVEAIRAQSGDAFLEARRDEQHALEALAARATEILAAAGRGSAALDRVLATLRAGSLTEDGRALLESGRLTEELEPPGFEALAGLDMPAGPPRPAKRAPASEARRRVRDLQRELSALEARAAAAGRRVEQLRKELRDAEAETSRLEEERRRAEEELAAAERDLRR